MRKNIVAGNWKMNKNLPEGLALVEETLQLLNADLQGETIVIFCPSFISLPSVSDRIKKEVNVFSAAQNCGSEMAGAFTGEVSASMIRSAGATYVILGHSERRLHFREGDAELAKKTDLVLQEGMKPIFCVGEPLEIREAGTHESLVESQLQNGLFHVPAEKFSEVVIAYEPVWAIGTGQVASDEQAQQMHAFIRRVISGKYGKEQAENTTILYGGSCKPSNAKGLFSQPDVDGGLIGGASLAASEFAGIISAFRQ